MPQVKPLSNNKSKKTIKSSSWISGMGGNQKYMGLGIQAGISVAFYLGVGLLLDKWLDTLPWLTLVGAGIGIVAMFSLFIRINKELSKASELEKARRESENT